MVEGLDTLDAAQANSYLELNLSCTALEQRLAAEVLSREALQIDIRGKANFLFRQLKSEERARRPLNPLAPAPPPTRRWHG